MSLVTCNGVDVLSGSIIRPLVGVWTADLILDQVDGTGFDPGTKVTIESENGYSITGVVDPHRAGNFLDAVHVRILGGGGGMNTIATPRGYVQPHAFVRDVLTGILGDAGETLSATSDTALLATNVTAWSVMGKPVSWNLRTLLGIMAPSMNWRVLADGTVWIGNESWPSATGTFDAITFQPSEGSYALGVESPFVAPGTNLDGVGNINCCVDTIKSGRLRTRVYIDMPSEGDRDIGETVGRLVKQATSGIDYFARYECQVVSQSADLATVDVNPVGDRNKKLIGGLQRVPVRFGTGIKIKFAPGAHVLLGWDGGNPSGHYVTDGMASESPLGIQLAGTHPAPLWDSFESAFNTFVNMFSGTNPIVVVATGIPSPGLVSAAQTIQGLITGHSFESQIVSNG